MILGCFRNKRGFLPLLQHLKNAQNIEKLLNALLLPKELVVTKFETHVKGEYGN